MSVRMALSLRYLETHPEAAAALLERFPAAEVASVLRNAPPGTAARAVASMAPAAGAASVLELQPEAAVPVLSAMSPEVASVVVRRLPPDASHRLLSALPDVHSRAIRRLLRFSERTAGALLDPLAAALPLDVGAAAALEWLKTVNPEHCDALFVVDRDQKLVGVVTLHGLIAARGDEPLESLMKAVPVRLQASTGVQAMLASPGWRDARVLPVVDDRGLFLGGLRQDVVRRHGEAGSIVTPSAATLRTVVSLSELYWTGCSRLITEVAALAHRTAASGRGA